MKLQEIVNMMNIKEHQQVKSVNFLIKRRIRMNVNEQLAEKWHKPVINQFKRRNLQDLKTIFWQQI